MRVLVIEDELAIQQHVKKTLEQVGYAVDVSSDGEDGLFQASEIPYDAAIIDLGLPKISGIEIIQQLRKQDIAFPILILTARDHWQEKVQGLSAGADDYVVKPFQPEEIVARINALIRRSSGFSSSRISLGVMTIDTAAQSVTINEQSVDLTAFEYKIIEYLVLNSEKVISKTELTEHVYAQDFEKDSNVIEVLVGRLRKKLDPTGKLKIIKTLRGRGYQVNSSSDAN